VSVKLYAAAADSDGEQLPPISSKQFSFEVDAWIERDKAIICKACVETIFNELSTDKNGGASG